jgi:hypothetical protein
MESGTYSLPKHQICYFFISKFFYFLPSLYKKYDRVSAARCELDGDEFQKWLAMAQQPT